VGSVRLRFGGRDDGVLALGHVGPPSLADRLELLVGDERCRVVVRAGWWE
jgi:hypothetical protein